MDGLPSGKNNKQRRAAAPVQVCTLASDTPVRTEAEGSWPWGTAETAQKYNGLHEFPWVQSVGLSLKEHVKRKGSMCSFDHYNQKFPQMVDLGWQHAWV